jgi:hypothetical protein
MTDIIENIADQIRLEKAKYEFLKAKMVISRKRLNDLKERRDVFINGQS